MLEKTILSFASLFPRLKKMSPLPWRIITIFLLFQQYLPTYLENYKINFLIQLIL
jgi:hypothetical protein